MFRAGWRWPGSGAARPADGPGVRASKRSWQVIVGADFEADDAVGFIAEAGQHEYRDVRLGANAAQNLNSIHARQHDVEQDGIEGAVEGEIEAVDAIVGESDVVAERLEISANEAAELFVVIDEQKAVAGIARGVTRGAARRRARRRCVVLRSGQEPLITDSADVCANFTLA